MISTCFWLRVLRVDTTQLLNKRDMIVPGSGTVNQAETDLVAVLGGTGVFSEAICCTLYKDRRLTLFLTK
ncbi:hypothetical protein WP3W18E01_29500 [Raoultella ornithinolytica]|nr:hypothetical protein WP3W18E01_29500 [Raoultella ornithinolytica]CAE6354773.1 hypothetical protein AI2711V1_2894 [Raoultella ornithinolytica]CAH3559232.1 hypothetical protein AI2711V1_2894 [Raoultella ornithinolytica]SMQ91175.1 Uncharacterised protein [Raoultella ornithinolytica]VTN44449.1 Uncharacterised protein [Raoultella ornithinolytica]